MNEITSREDIKKTIEMLNTLTEMIGKVDQSRHKASEIAGRKCISFEVYVEVPVEVTCDKMYKFFNGELKEYNEPAALVLDRYIISVYSIEGMNGKEVGPVLPTSRKVQDIYLNDMLCYELLELAAYEKQCKVLTKMKEKLEEYIKRMEEYSKMLKNIEALLTVLGYI